MSKDAQPGKASEATPADPQVVAPTKKARAKPKAKRTFPRYSIEEARKIAEALKQFNAGNPWNPKEIAAAGKMGTGDPFFYLTAGSRDYGFTLGTREAEKIELTYLGRKLVYPKSQEEESSAIHEAFRNIELFKNVYDYYQGQNLPEIQYLKNTLKTEFGVDEELQDDFYELYQKT